MFKLVDKRYSFDGGELWSARDEAEITQVEFATFCGWSAQYQWRLENGLVETIGDAARCALLNAFSHFGKRRR